MKTINFEPIILRKQVSDCGGGVEIDLTTLGFRGERMAVYQNYLGGGLLGKICVNDTVRLRHKALPSERQARKLDQIGEQLKKYLFELTNPDSEWESMTFEQNQNMPVAGY